MDNLWFFLLNIKNFNIKYLKILIAPIYVFVILIMIILPLPPFLLDLLFTFNISISIIILLVTIFSNNILDFSGFPLILLLVTLMRLFLNVASTRAILLYGHTGVFSVGNVIESFGKFLIGGNFSIGIIIFIILVIINFIVITKGAERVAEVNARFILDSIPGKQMSVDSDLNSGLINKKQAKKKRENISKESDFYGSMDGASKFIRGDAVAGILILIINIFGGLFIGIWQHNLSLFEALHIYTLLTIGDGLVAQIPSLIVSIAAGIIVTRVNYKQDLSKQIIRQLFYDPRVLFFSAVVLGIFGLIPGMPNFVFLFFSLLIFFIFFLVNNKNDIKKKKKNNNNFKRNKNIKYSLENIKLEDIIRIELGYNLINLVNVKSKFNLLNRITEIRKKIANNVGFLPPSVHICNNFKLDKNSYCFYIKGVEITQGKIFCDYIMAINPGNAKKKIFLKKIKDPVFGLSSYWIDKKLKNLAEKSGYIIVKPKSVFITHIYNFLLNNIHELLGHQEVRNLLNLINKSMPKLTEELIPNLISFTTFHIILRKLIFEKIYIIDIYTIIETLLKYSCLKKFSVNDLVSFIRISLGRYITQKFFSKKKKIIVIGLDYILERKLLKKFKNKNKKKKIKNILLKNIINQLKIAIKNQIKINAPLVLLVHHKLRYNLFKLLHNTFPSLVVLSLKEIVFIKRIFYMNIIYYVKDNNIYKN
ncbi:FHIPEP family type III secretion protein [Buchnera aphidicola]|uniref:FHIPEP family type III secretion protein n=1 Tax=Buchnera aphidicola TaxID=9 RepID=UPI0031B8AB05